MSTEKEPMSQAEYVQMKGAQCPFCRSTDIEGGPFNVNEGTASQEMGCNECDAEWADTYTLTGYAE